LVRYIRDELSKTFYAEEKGIGTIMQNLVEKDVTYAKFFLGIVIEEGKAYSDAKALTRLQSAENILNAVNTIASESTTEDVNSKCVKELCNNLVEKAIGEKNSDLGKAVVSLIPYINDTKRPDRPQPPPRALGSSQSPATTL
jgi:hypothetical protein